MYGMRPTRMSGRLRRRGVGAEASHDVVERVALRRYLAGSADQRDQLVERHRLRRVRSNGMIDLFAYHGAFHVVHAEGQRDLGQEGRDHDPVCLDVREVVEEEPTDGEVAQIVEPGGRRTLATEMATELVVVGMVGERAVGEEPTRLVLQIAEHGQMLD